MLITLFYFLCCTVDPSDFLSEAKGIVPGAGSRIKEDEGLAQWSVHFPKPRFPGSSYFLFDMEGNVLGNSVISEELLSAYQKTSSEADPTIVFKRGRSGCWASSGYTE